MYISLQIASWYCFFPFKKLTVTYISNHGNLQMKLATTYVHFFPFVNPFIFTILGVECSFLYWAQLQSKPRSQLLQTCFLGILKYIPMVPKENKISLIVKCNYPSSCKLGIIRKKGSQRATYSMTKSSTEIIHDNFWPMLWQTTMVFDVPNPLNGS